MNSIFAIHARLFFTRQPPSKLAQRTFRTGSTYVGAIESSTLFGLCIHKEALRRGSQRARQIIVLTDGARYNKTIATTHFPGAVHIIDLYRAREHLGELAKALDLDGTQQSHWNGLLDMGRIEDLLSEAATRIEKLSLSAPKPQELQKMLGYFRENADLMRYANFRLAGHFVGSGVVEAGCRTVIGQRLMHSVHVLERARSQCHHRPAMLSALRSFRGLLGNRRLNTR